MLRRFLLGIMVVSVASLAWAGVPDLNVSTATIDAAANGASVYVLPNGGGVALDNAFGAAGGRVDATITLTLIDTQGLPIFGYPPSDLWLETSGGGLVYCANGTSADLATDENGQTEWANPLAAGGNSGGETVLVYVAGAPLAGGGLDITFNSADITADLVVNLSDIGEFTQRIGGTDYAADFNFDGVVNLTDIADFTQAIGAQCN